MLGAWYGQTYYSARCNGPSMACTQRDALRWQILIRSSRYGLTKGMSPALPCSISACCTILPKGSEEHMVSISNYAEAGPRSVAVVSLEQHSIVALAVKRNDYVCSGHRPW